MLHLFPHVDGDEDNEPYSDGDDEIMDEILQDAENVELAVPWVAGSSEVAVEPEVHTKYVPQFTLYLVGKELGDGASTSAAGYLVRSVVCPTLPEGLVEEVLLRLPAAAQARCRAVCKDWLAMLSCPEFLRRTFFHSLSQTTSPLCAVRHFPSRDDFVPLQNLRRAPRYKSLRVDLSFLPEEFHYLETCFHNCAPCGLMCISRRGSEGTHVCVFNPVNQSFKVLPMLPKLTGRKETAVLMVGAVTATESIPSFKVYVPGLELSPESECLSVDNDNAIYSSISGEWKGFLGQEMTGGSAAACNGDLYSGVHSTPRRLVRRSTERGPANLWNLALPSYKMDRGTLAPGEYCLAAHRGRLLLCCDGIWMLDDAGKLWVKIVERCPPDILPTGPPETHTLLLKAVHVAEDLVICVYKLSCRCGEHRQKHCPVGYDMLGRFWRKVPQIFAQVQAVFQPMPNLRF